MSISCGSQDENICLDTCTLVDTYLLIHVCLHMYQMYISSIQGDNDSCLSGGLIQQMRVFPIV
jgi:hypothetical protein